VTTDVAAPAAGQDHALEEMWRRQQVVWHALFAALLVVAGVVVLLEPSTTRGPQLACLVAMAVAYVVWGVRGLARQGTAGLVYVLVVWALFLLLVGLDAEGEAWLLTFAVFPQTWAMVPRRTAVVVVVAGIAVFTGLRVWQVSTTDEGLGGLFVASLIMLALSLAMGLFVDRLVTEAESRSQALRELRLAQADLAAAERAQGVSAERERMSREIHDTLAQGFTSVLTLARATESALERGDLDAVRERLRLIERTAADNLTEARLIVAETTPGHLQSRSLAQALQRLVDAVTEGTGLPAGLEVEGDPAPLPAACEVVLLRTAQEGLANARRHARASRVVLRLSYLADVVSLEIADDGMGFDADARRPGYGLDGATARAGEVGGRLEVTSAPGAGTVLRVEVPR
jgi:signal transduction histidine kinase